MSTALAGLGNQSSGFRWATSITQPNEGAFPHQGELFEIKKAQVLAQGVDIIEEVLRHYLATDSTVVSFLRMHRPIAYVLLDAVPSLLQCFGTRPLLKLKAPFDESGTQMLYAVVAWPGDIREVRDALTRFDDEWWLSRVQSAAGQLTYTYELM